MAMEVEVSARKLAVALLLVISLLTVASLAARSIIYIWGREGLLSFLPLFNVGEEATVPTWYSSSTLLLTAALLGVIAAAKKKCSDPFTLHWGILCTIFLFLSVDEVATIHEHVGDVSTSLVEAMGFDPRGFIYFFWVVPAIIFLVVLAVAYLRFFMSLPKWMRILILAAGLTFVVGAVGFEMLSARLVSFYGESWDYGAESIPTSVKVATAIQSSIEELLEMLGVAIFVYALVSYIGFYLKDITVQFRVNK